MYTSELSPMGVNNFLTLSIQRKCPTGKLSSQPSACIVCKFNSVPGLILRYTGNYFRKQLYCVTKFAIAEAKESTLQTMYKANEIHE